MSESVSIPLDIWKNLIIPRVLEENKWAPWQRQYLACVCRFFHRVVSQIRFDPGDWFSLDCVPTSLRYPWRRRKYNILNRLQFDLRPQLLVIDAQQREFLDSTVLNRIRDTYLKTPADQDNFLLCSIPDLGDRGFIHVCRTFNRVLILDQLEQGKHVIVVLACSTTELAEWLRKHADVHLDSRRFHGVAVSSPQSSAN